MKNPIPGSFRRWKHATSALFLAAVLVPAQAADRQIYPPPAQAKADLAAGIKAAAAAHKRVLVDFGGDWCGDCQVLDIYFHDAANRPILESNYVLVHVNVGQMDTNLDLASRLGVPIEKGVPALAVLDGAGKVVYSQRTGEFNSMRTMQSTAVTQFLIRWKPAKPGCSTVRTSC